MPHKTYIKIHLYGHACDLTTVEWLREWPLESYKPVSIPDLQLIGPVNTGILLHFTKFQFLYIQKAENNIIYFLYNNTQCLSQDLPRSNES